MRCLGGAHFHELNDNDDTLSSTFADCFVGATLPALKFVYGERRERALARAQLQEADNTFDGCDTFSDIDANGADKLCDRSHHPTSDMLKLGRILRYWGDGNTDAEGSDIEAK